MDEQLLTAAQGRGRLLLFAKAPRLGSVKTRMQPYLSPEQSLQLHKNLLQHCLHTLQQSNLAPLTLWGSEPHPYWQQSPCDAVELKFQVQGDLGQKMAAAVEQALRRADWVIVVGSDCPFIDRRYLTMAVNSLLSGRDAVLGPATDGGYVLLGLRRYSPQLFRQIAWGESCVLAQTQARLQALGWNWDLLPPRSDIDRPEDLALLQDAYSGLSVG